MPLKLAKNGLNRAPLQIIFTGKTQQGTQPRLQSASWIQGTGSATELHKTISQPNLHLQLRLVRSYLLKTAKGCQLVVCLWHGNCLRVPYRNPQLPTGAAQGAQSAFAMNSHSSFNSSVCNIWISFPLTPDTACLWQVTNSTAQSHGFQILFAVPISPT